MLPAAASETAVPPALADWVPWVLESHPDRNCPFFFADYQQRVCGWPSTLALQVADERLSFSMRWRMYAEGFAILPGEKGYWPEQVQVDGQLQPVLARDGRPQIALAAGSHQISGSIRLQPVPASLALPELAGLVALTIDGEQRRHVAIDEGGRLWLKPRQDLTPGRAGDSLSLRVYRKLADGVPMLMETRLELEVSGKAREVLLGPAMLPGFAPLSLHSPLPARLEADGQLRLQVRPGSWKIRLQARALGQPAQFSLVPGANWPAQEIWSLLAEPALRSWRVEGVTGVDPGQAGVPDDWASLPAYPMSATGSLQLVEESRRRDSADSLRVKRELWRDFAGTGYTFRDRISGMMSADGRLEGDGLEPGRVLVNGAPAMITLHQGGKGVELRRGEVDVEVIGRLAASDSLPASGWGRDLEQLQVVLHQPPGTLLWGGSGVDHISTAWVSRWSLWDIFLLLVLVVGSFRLAGPLAAVVAALALLLSHGVVGAPWYSWLNLLVVLALLKVLPAGRARRAVQLWLALTLLALALLLLPFAVQQFRQAVYPQLELPDLALKQGQHYPESAPAQEAPMAPAEAELSRKRSRAESGYQLAISPLSSQLSDAPLPADISADTDARIQTGPGVPDWRWRQAQLTWQGPVSADQQFRLWQSGDLVFRLVSVLRVLLMLAWLALLLHALAKTRWTDGQPAVSGVAALLLALLLPWQSDNAHADLPSAELLQELEQRLTQAPNCLPACADISEARVQVRQDGWQVRLRVQAGADVMLPLPGGAASWQPQRVWLNGAAAEALRQQAGQLHIALPAGVHDLLLQGPAPLAERVALRFEPAPQRIIASASGWRLAGIVDHLLPSGTLELTREEKGAAEDNRLVNPLEPAFARVTRILHLGMDWRLETLVQRLAPAQGPLSIDVALVEGEQVLSDVPVEDGKAHIQLGADQQQLRWWSRLEPVAQLALVADDSDRFTLDWRLIADTRWHVSHEGLSPLLLHSGAGTRWLPWPGDSVTLNVERPSPAPGETLTIEAADLRWQPGQRESRGELTLNLLSSRGDNYRLPLPPGSRLQSVTLDGVSQPLADDSDVLLAVAPGQHTAVIEWRSDQGRAFRTRTPTLDLGQQVANIRVTLEQPRDRWSLALSGPGYGPALLFWGVLGVILLLALALGRLPLSPLSSGQWMLLALGISSNELLVAVPVVLWFFALSLRARQVPDGRLWFNAMQVLLALLTVLAMLSLLALIPASLVLGSPDMQISGNGSSARHLVWYLDSSSGVLPAASVVSLPLWVWRALMLLWSLWLALALMRWLPWAWRCFSAGGLWRAPGKVLTGSATPGD